MSRLETLLRALQTRLEAISTAGGYSQDPVRVERRRKEAIRDQILGNRIADLPVILVASSSGETGAETEQVVNQRALRANVEIYYLLDGNSGDPAVVAALADLEKAIYLNWDGLGVGALDEGYAWEVEDQDGVPWGGLRLTATFTYRHDNGDPSTLTG